MRFVALVMVMLWSLPAAALQGFQRTQDCGFRIDYPDWTGFLRQVVMDVGMPDRDVLPRPTPSTGKRIYRGSRKPTRAEANRVFYHLIQDGGVVALGKMRQSLVDTANDPGFTSLCSNERLALWLNLHNITVVEMVAAEYPMRNAQRFVAQRMDKPLFQIAGKNWSLGDLEAHVMTTWQHPLVAYGFHRGHIGSPNMRRTAFTGDRVWDALESNAREFTSSLRGVRFEKDGRARVSEFYKSVDRLFPNFAADLKAHMIQYAVPKIVSKLSNAHGFKANVSDGTVADLYEGVTSNLQTTSNNPAALLGAVPVQNLGALMGRATNVSDQNLPPRVVRFVRRVVLKKAKRRFREGVVTLEEVAGNK